MHKLVVLVALIVLSVYAYVLYPAKPFSDELGYAEDSTAPVKNVSSYEKAAQIWQSQIGRAHV